MIGDFGSTQSTPQQPPLVPNSNDFAMQTACSIIEIVCFLFCTIVLTARTVLPLWPVYLLWGAAAMLKSSLWYDNTDKALWRAVAVFNGVAGIGLFITGMARLLK